MGVVQLASVAIFLLQLQPSWALVSFMDSTQEMIDWCSARSCNPDSSYSLVVGETITFNVTGIHINQHRNATIAVLSNPGLPNAARVTSVTMLNFSVDVNGTVHWAAQREFTFTPTANQEGISFRVCFRAVDVENAAIISDPDLCPTLHVMAPAPAFHVNHTQESGLQAAVGVNCPVDIRVTAVDAGGGSYCMEVHPGRVGEGAGEMKYGAHLRFLSQSSVEKRGDYDGCGAAEYQVLWYPRRGQEGASYTLCVHVGDTFCAGNGLRGRVCTERQVERCFTVPVVKCQYCLAAGETIMAAAARYKTDWLQLWGANPHLPSPDTLPAYQPLTLGPMYAVRAADTLEALAARFGTSATNILDANPDVDLVDDRADLHIGDHICILPWVCLTEQESYAAGAYIAHN